MTVWPYCEHEGCHSARTNSYGQAGVTGSTATDWDTITYPKQATLYGPYPAGSPWPGFKRWCRHHAMQHEGWSVGS